MWCKFGIFKNVVTLTLYFVRLPYANLYSAPYLKAINLKLKRIRACMIPYQKSDLILKKMDVNFFSLFVMLHKSSASLETKLTMFLWKFEISWQVILCLTLWSSFLTSKGLNKFCFYKWQFYFCFSFCMISIYTIFILSWIELLPMVYEIFTKCPTSTQKIPSSQESFPVVIIHISYHSSYLFIALDFLIT